MDLQDSLAAEAVIAIITFVAYVVPLVAIFKVFSWADKSLQGVAKGFQGAFRKAGKLGYKYGKKGAMDTTQGQKVRQFLGHRQAISQLKGKEALRETLNASPKLRRLMGGAGGEAYAARFLDTENRKHEAQQIEELSKGMTLPMAKAMSKHQNLRQALEQGYFDDGKQSPLKDEDKTGIRKLIDQGYLDQNGVVPGGGQQSYIAASAALEQMYKADDINATGLAGLGQMLQGAGAEANAKFTELNRSAAVKNKSKNVAFASFSDGKMDQFANKPPEGLMASGLQGVNKDALKYSNVDLPSPEDKYNIKPGENMYLSRLRKEAVNDDGSRNYAKILERTRQTMEQNHEEVLEGLSYAMGFGDFDPSKVRKTDRTEAQKAAIQAQVNKLNQLRNALQNGSTATPPPEFAPVLGKEVPTPSGNNSNNNNSDNVWPPPDRPSGPNPYM